MPSILPPARCAATVERTPDFFPIYTVGRKLAASRRLWTDWTGGFLRRHDVEVLRAKRRSAVARPAEHYSRLLEHRQHDRNVHDLGFIFLNTYLPWFELTGDDRLRDVLVTGRPHAGPAVHAEGQYLRSFVAPESLFIDIMMNVPLIFYAAK